MNRNNSTITKVSAIPAREIEELVQSAETVLILSHIDPDGDALGSQLAFAEYVRSLGKQAVLIREAVIPSKYSFLPSIETITHIDELPVDFSCDLAVVLECPSYERMGRASSYLTPNLPIINIDHHFESGDFGDVRWIDPTRSSVGEMIYEYFSSIEFSINASIATQLYTAIITDTGRFRYQSTSPRTMVIAGELIGAGANPKSICDKVYFNLSQSTMLLTSHVLRSMEFLEDGTICFLTLTHDMLEKSGADRSESDGLVDFTMFTDKVIAGVLFKEGTESNTRVSLRSRDGINVAEIASTFGGGGHFNASGCTIPKNIDESKKIILKALSEKIHG